MVSLLDRLVEYACDLDPFKQRKDVYTFAVYVTFSVTLVADILSAVVHFWLHYVGLLPYDVLPAILVGILISTILASILTFSVAFIFGLAMRHLTVSRAEFEKLSRTDALSGLLNRRALMAQTSFNPSGSLILFDIDRFKSINDEYGHDVGDLTIVAVATRLRDVFGSNAVIARIGGEEFAVLTTSSLSISFKSARRCVREMSARPIDVGQNQIIVTMSGGVADCAGHQSFETVYTECDKALYLAKASGRNCVVRSNASVSLGKLGRASVHESLLDEHCCFPWVTTATDVS